MSEIAAKVLSDPRFAERYQLGDMLGEGGMGAVFRGEQSALGRPVAIKFLAATFLKDDEYRERFVREAKLAAGLIHSNVVAVFDFGVAAGHPYLVTELVDGESLASLIQRTPAPDPASTLHIVRAVLDGLEAIHRLAIVHRDLKPANVLVGTTPPPVVKIADFGIAKQTIGGQGGLTAVGVLLGSPAYLAPEQITGDPVSPATDLYALTIVLWKMIVGTHPFPATNAASMLLMQRNSIPEVPPALLPSVRQALARGMVKDPAHRFKSAAEMRAALAAVEAEVQRTGGWWLVEPEPARADTLQMARTARTPAEPDPPAETIAAVAPPPPPVPPAAGSRQAAGVLPPAPDPPLRAPTSPPVFALPPPIPLKKKPQEQPIVDLPPPPPPQPERSRAPLVLVPLAILWGLYLVNAPSTDAPPQPPSPTAAKRPASPSPKPAATVAATPAPAADAIAPDKARAQLAAIERLAAGRKPTDAVAQLVALSAKLPSLARLTPGQVARDAVAPEVDRALLSIVDNALGMMPPKPPPPPADAATGQRAEPFVTALALRLLRSEFAEARALLARFREAGADGARLHRASSLAFIDQLLALRLAKDDLELVHAMRELEVLAHAHPDHPVGAWANALVAEVMAAAQLGRAPGRQPSTGWPYVEGGISDVQLHLRTNWFDARHRKIRVGDLRRAIIVSDCVLTLNDRAWRDSGAVPTSIPRELLQQRLKNERLAPVLVALLRNLKQPRISLVQPMPPAAVLALAKAAGIRNPLAAPVADE